MSWRSEFSKSHEVPPWFFEHLDDESWHNDVSPRFSYGKFSRPDEHHRWVNVWVAHVDPDHRESPDDLRYMVEVWEGTPDEGDDDPVASIPAIETDDMQEAIDAIRKRASELGLEPPPAFGGSWRRGNPKPPRGKAKKRSTPRTTNVGKLRARLTNIELGEVPIGTDLMVETADRKHPFRATVRRRSGDNIVLETRTSTIEIVRRADGSVSHVARWPIKKGAFPQETQLRWWKLAE